MGLSFLYKGTKQVSLLLFLVFISLGLSAQSTDGELFSLDEEDLFSDTEMVEEIDEESSFLIKESVTEDLLVSEGVELGGSFSCSMSGNWNWVGKYIDLSDPDDFNSRGLTADLHGRLFFDARPDADFRVFGKAEFAYPFSFHKIDQEGDLMEGSTIRIVEFFSDFNWKNRLFFKVGKQNISSGVGYFFSPADVLSLASIDPDDPEAEREGPVALKIHFPFSTHNLYGFLIIPTNALSGDLAGGDVSYPEDVGLSARGEFFLWNWEFGIGAYYQKKRVPRFLSTASGSWGDFDLFAEVTGSWGSDRTFVQKEPLPYSTYTKEDELLLSATAGFRYIWSDEGGNINVSATGQYYYNGEGYGDAKDLSIPITAALIAGEITPADLYIMGTHYGAGIISLFDFFKTDLGFSLFWYGNLSDGSGYFTPSLTWKVFDYANISLKVPVFYGEEGGELTPLGKGMTVTVSLTLGSGRF